MSSSNDNKSYHNYVHEVVLITTDVYKVADSKETLD